MKKLFFLSFLLFSSLLYIPAARAATTPDVKGTTVLQGLLEKIASYKIKDLQKLAGRKFTMKEKLSFWLLKRQLKKKENNGFTGKLTEKILSKKNTHHNNPAKSDEPKSKGQTAFIFGLVGAVLLVAGFFIPYVILAGLLSAILAIALGTIAYKKDPTDAKAKAGKLLGWITLGLFALIVIVVVIAWTNSDWW